MSLTHHMAFLMCHFIFWRWMGVLFRVWQSWVGNTTERELSLTWTTWQSKNILQHTNILFSSNLLVALIECGWWGNRVTTRLNKISLPHRYTLLQIASLLARLWHSFASFWGIRKSAKISWFGNGAKKLFLDLDRCWAWLPFDF